jgi:hypothetical protein
MSMPEIARRYSVNRETVATAGLQYVKIGYNRMYLYKESELIALMESTKINYTGRRVSKYKPETKIGFDNKLSLDFLRGEL